jgi:outer membrane protein assembly factor BamB
LALPSGDARTRDPWDPGVDECADSGAIKGSLATDGRRLFIGTYAGEVAALDKRGTVLWRSGGHGAFYSSPAAAYGRVFIGSLDSGVYAFGATTGHLLWSRPTGGYVYASPAISSHLVLIGSYSRRFYALSAATGLVRWIFTANGPIPGSASVIDGLVYLSTFNRRTYALKTATGREVATWPDGKYSPAVADSRHLYLVGLGRLYAMTPG